MFVLAANTQLNKLEYAFGNLSCSPVINDKLSAILYEIRYREAYLWVKLKMDLLSGYQSDGEGEEDPGDDHGFHGSSYHGRDDLRQDTEHIPSAVPEKIVVPVAHGVDGVQRKIRPCQALLDDEEPETCNEKHLKSYNQYQSVEPIAKRMCLSATSDSNVFDAGENRHATAQPPEFSTSVAHVLDHPPLQIASIGSIPRNQRPACKPPRRKIHTFHGHTASVFKVSWMEPHGQLLASCGMDGQFCIWEPWVRRQCLRKLYPHQTQAVRCGQWYGSASSSIQFLSGGYDKYLRLTDVETGQCSVSVAHDAYVTALARHPTHRDVVVTGTSQRSIAVWDMRCSKVRSTAVIHPSLC